VAGSAGDGSAQTATTHVRSSAADNSPGADRPQSIEPRTASVAPISVARIDDPPASGHGDVASEQASRPGEQAEFTTLSIRGRVVWLADVLRRRYGVELTRDAQERTLALETPDGQIHPLVEDLRGRSFRTDERLRNMDVELLVRRYEGSPLVQIIRIHEVREGGKFIVDYWCDVCAIEMYEFGSCACCQDQNRLRKRRID
jgi:hypothetical protein